jgi:hypothetical protein
VGGDVVVEVGAGGGDLPGGDGGADGGELFGPVGGGAGSGGVVLLDDGDGLFSEEGRAPGWIFWEAPNMAMGMAFQWVAATAS